MVLSIQLRRNLVGLCSQNEARRPAVLWHEDVVVIVMWECRNGLGSESQDIQNHDTGR